MLSLESSEEFPIDLDDVYPWVGWSTKQQAKEVLLNNFIEETDFLRKGLKNPSVGRPSEWIVLTVDCFKSLAMMAGTPKGREVRQYFIDCETELKKNIDGVSAPPICSTKPKRRLVMSTRTIYRPGQTPSKDELIIALPSVQKFSRL